MFARVVRCFFFAFCCLEQRHWAQCSLRGGDGFFFKFCKLGQWHWAQCSLGGGGVLFSRFVSKNIVIGLSVR